MKQIAALVLAMLLALSLLAGCTPEQQADTPPVTTAGNTETTGQTEDTDPTELRPTEATQIMPSTERDGIELPDIPLE